MTEIKDLLTDIRELLQMNSSPWLTTERAVEYTGLSRSTIMDLIKTRRIPVYRPTKNQKRLILSKADLDKFIPRTKKLERGRKRKIDNELEEILAVKQEV